MCEERFSVSIGWVAGSRPRTSSPRPAGGTGGALRLAALPLQEALAELAAMSYGRQELGADFRSAQRAVAATTLLELRVLAGWLPPGRGGPSRGAWPPGSSFANIKDCPAYLLGGEAGHPFDLGSLVTAWPALAAAQSPGELWAALAGSAWGNPRSKDLAT